MTSEEAFALLQLLADLRLQVGAQARRIAELEAALTERGETS